MEHTNMTDLPNEVLLEIFSYLFTYDYYDILNFSRACPQIAPLLNKYVHYFVIHGYSNTKSKASQKSHFSSWFFSSMSLVEEKSATDNAVHFFMKDANIKNSEQIYSNSMRWAYSELAALSPAFMGGYNDVYLSASHLKFLYGEGRFSDQARIYMNWFYYYRTRGYSRFRDFVFPRLLNNEIVKRWFQCITDTSRRYKHIVIILNLCNQTIYTDFGIIIKNLFMEKYTGLPRFSTDFSVVSIKSEISQDWLFAEPVAEGTSTLLDCLTGAELKHSDGEIVLETYHEDGVKRGLCSREKRLDTLKARNVFSTIFDSAINSKVLRNLKIEQSRVSQAYSRRNLNSINSITKDISNLKSYDLILLRDSNNVSSLKSSREYSIEYRMFDRFIVKPSEYSIYSDYALLESSISKINSNLTDIFKARKMNLSVLHYDIPFKALLSTKISKKDITVNCSRWRSKYTTGLAIEKKLSHQSKSLFKEFMSSLPWIAGYPLAIRMRLYKSSDNREVDEIKFRKHETESKAKYAELVRKPTTKVSSMCQIM